MGLKYWTTLAENVSESTSWTACAGTGGSSPYYPEVAGRIVGLRTVVGNNAATTLTCHGEFKLSCGLWNVTPKVAYQGAGLMTVPAFAPQPLDYACDLPIAPGNPIIIEARALSADTEVTNGILLEACIQTS